MKIRAKIFGSLRAGYLSIHIGFGYGMNNGGGLREVKINEIPEDCRMPNTYLWVELVKGEIKEIEKMSKEEIMIHSNLD